jgi:hypothetical protein
MRPEFANLIVKGWKLTTSEESVVETDRQLWIMTAEPLPSLLQGLLAAAHIEDSPISGFR